VDIKSFIESLGEKKEELIKKAMQCKNEGELQALANEHGVALDEESAAEIFASMQLKPGKLSDDELDTVAGGSGSEKPSYLCPSCGNRCVWQTICHLCGYKWK